MEAAWAALRTLRYTDDTHMTLGFARSLVERRGFDGPHLAATFVRNFAAEPWRGYGAGPPRVFRLLSHGMAWDQAGRTLFGGSGSFGNGAAMRAAPAGLAAFRDLDRVAALARAGGRITHSHELGLDGAALQACAVAIVLRTPPGALDPGALLAQLGARAKTQVFRDRLEAVRALLPAAPGRAVVRAVGNGIAAHEAVPAALYAFLRERDSFADAVRFAVCLGGDTDTIASMAGALSGAYLGEQAIPPRWRETLEGAEELRGLADALLALALEDRVRAPPEGVGAG